MKSRKYRVNIAVNYCNFSNEKKQKLQDVALSISLGNKPNNVHFYAFDYVKNVKNNTDNKSAYNINYVLKRSSKETIGNNRDLPYIKEILDCCYKVKGDVFGYINSDIILTKDFYKEFNELRDAYFYSRYDISVVSKESFENKDYKIFNQTHPGADAFFFSRNWWGKNNKKINNDLIMGECEWDFYYMKFIKEYIPNYLSKRNLFHVYHDTIWNIDSVGGKNNRNINRQLSV